MSDLLFHPNLAPKAPEAPAKGRPHPHDGIELPANMAALFMEFYFYLVVFMSAYANRLGIAQFRGLIGTLIYLGGLLAFALFLYTGRRIPTSVWFAIAVNVFVNLSQIVNGQIPLISESRTVTFWLCFIAMMSYIMRNEAASRRSVLFISLLMLFEVANSGGFVMDDRLAVDVVDATFANPNKLGYMTGAYALVILFWSMRASAVLRPILWGTAVALIAIVLLSLSRGATLALAVGLCVLVIGVMGGRGMRVGGLVILLGGVILAASFSYVLVDTAERIEARTERGSQDARVAVYSVGTLLDLIDTFVIGWGGEGELIRIKSHAKVNPHNSFLKIHMAYGGIAAWIFAAWLMTMALRSVRMALDSRVGFGLKAEIACLFGMMMVCLIFTNEGFTYYSSMYIVCFIDKYTMPYSARDIARRRMRVQGNGTRAFNGPEPDSRPTTSLA